MKYLITGAAGFIGQHLCRILAVQGHAVTGVDIKPRPNGFQGNFYQDTILDLPRMSTLADECDGIFHLAAIASVTKTIEAPLSTRTTNVTGTQNMLEAARQNGNIPFVYASSAAVYGDTPTLPLKETLDGRPLSPYAEHKLANETDAKAYGTTHGLPSFGLRFFNLYGTGQDPTSPYSGVISIFHQKLGAGEPLMMFGDGTQTRDFVFIDDAIAGLISSLAHANPQAPVCNVCTGQQTSLLTLAETLGNIMHIKPDIHFQPARAGDIRHSCGDPAYFKTLTGFIPKTPLKEGLKALLKPNA